ncbi:helicase-like protein [Micromonospora kangleipakensis]|uniref:Helicase-like protein n=1 Tax=Micromonospora kangleipakensis TaxID=1077942 RepID=A0A4Q8BCC0_9ACTN|nr:DISARM system helicase DrmA [Micromonospora kangleipakensis]RZU75502.1 helicase-like protein [Micromonospora kangleipakensis]
MVDVQGGLFPHPRGEQQALTMPGRDDADQQALIQPLDVPQTFPEATSYQVRDELEELIGRDLLGPWDGEHEEFRPGAMGPRERYLVGMLGPKQRPRSDRREAAEVADVDAAVQGDGSEAELPEVVTPQNLGKMWASSMGLSFAVPGDVDVLSVTADWGRYDLRESEDEKGKKRRVWFREPVSYRKEVRLDGETSYRMPLTVPDEDDPGVHLAVEVRPRNGGRVVQLALINTQMEATSNGDTAWLFQTALTVTALDGDAAVFLPIDDPLDGVRGVDDDQEETHLRLLYRSQRRYAAGRNVAVHPSVRDGERWAHQLVTTWLPTYNVPATVAQVGKGSGLAGVELSMDALAAADIDRLRTGLAPLADGYEAWLDDEEAKIPGLPEPLRNAAEAAVFTARRAAERIRAGIALLTNPEADKHADALAAFRFANEAMALQRRHSEVGRLREDKGLSYAEAKAAIDGRGTAAASWRPFQLAFVLLNLPSITDPAHPERAANRDATVDLLFFPTGGGKTEAYLGLTAFAFAIRRRQGVIGAGADARSGEAGVAVLMRYTLRLLTAQQFQRAAALVCAAEVLRRKNERSWGTEPFRIGLWVGGGVSPNWYNDAAEQIAEAREAGNGKFTNVLQTLSCPWCGSKLRAERDLVSKDDLRRVFLYCPEAEGTDACPFSRTRSPEGLPILTVDEEIYRYAPSLVIATVDKLAQLPWRGFAGLLFGRVRERCPRHGYRHDDLDARTGCGARHNKKGKLEAATSRPVIRLRPPDLIIQDELHLISGALGTTVGLFEAAVDQLCTWPLPGGGEAGPKIVASTATTKRAREQVLGVFGRDLAVFPPPVIDITDTFFSRQVPVTVDNPGRRYLGVCAHGIRMKSAEIRIAEILLLAGQTLIDRYGQPADPYLTTVGYFNATRELAGMRRILDDQVATRVRSHGRRKGLSDRLVGTQMLNVQELTSRISSGDISDVLKRLEIGFDPELDTSARRRAILDDAREAYKSKTASNPRPALHPVSDRFYKRQNEGQVPVDAVLATSMLQVGVDVSRFGLMVVTGQPKNTAEYIQASSRVGRDAKRPGLVITLYNWTRPRDLAHYEDFEYYHATFYRQVEALSVTPYTRRSLDRSTTATLVAAMRNAEEAFSRNTDAQDVPLDGPEVQQVFDRFLKRAEAIAGERGRDYLQERINRLKDLWNERKTGAVRLGYDKGTFKQQQLNGLLVKASGERWTDLTVGQSMRETENEINLVLPAGGELFTAQYGAPDWSFGAPTDDTRDEDLPDGDEMGESTLAGKGN